MDTTDAAAQKAESKTGRRASLARALHVPSSIARRVKQFEPPGEIKEPPTSKPTTQDGSQVSAPGKSMDAKSSPMALFTREVHLTDDDVGGADIPNIPLRRSPNIRSINSDLGGVNSLATLERILGAGDTKELLPPMGTISLASARLRAEKRYEGQCDDLSLYPVSECSWESSLADVPEASSSAETSLRRETSSSPNLQGHDKRGGLGSIHEANRLTEQSVEMPTSSSGMLAASPLRREPNQPTNSASIPSLSTTYVQTERSFSNTLLQTKPSAEIHDGLHPVDEDSDPNNFDLIIPTSTMKAYNVERRCELLFSAEHLRVIFSDPVFLHRFASFVAVYRPQSMQLLNYTLDALKAIRAMEYMNHIISHSLRPVGQSQQFQYPHVPHYHQQTLREFSSLPGPDLTVNDSLLQKTAAAFQALARDELPAYVTHVWADIIEASMKKKITAMMPAKLQDSNEALAEVFVVTDPSRQDNPIVFASDEFHRTTHYGPDYVFGRNCRFLQGPKTNPSSTQRLREMVLQGKEHYETLLNYRRDGLPFVNLLMCSPLLDSMGNVRYYLGAQLDVSHLAKDCSGLESLRRLADQDEEERRRRQEQADNSDSDFDRPSASPGTARTADRRSNSSHGKKDEFRLLAEMLNRNELETVRRHGGRMHRSQQEQVQYMEPPSNWHKPRVVLYDDHEMTHASSPQEAKARAAAAAAAIAPTPRQPEQVVTDANGNISLSARSPPPTASSSSSAGGLRLSSLPVARPPAIFENYLVVRPYPSLRILFASPSLRVPGTLQSHLMSRIGGSRRIHEELEYAFAMGEGVTAKVKWISGSGLRNNTGSSIFGDKSGGGTSIPDNASGSTHSGSASLGSPETVGMEGRLRWIQCTPLFGANGDVGVWVVVIMDDDGGAGGEAAARSRRHAEPSSSIRSQQQTSPGSDQGGYGDEIWSSADYAALNSLPEDEDLRRHVRKMYGETRRRERGDDGRDWEKGWKKDDATSANANSPAGIIGDVEFLRTRSPAVGDVGVGNAANTAAIRSKSQSGSVTTSTSKTEDSTTTSSSGKVTKRPRLLQI